jgi:hypothetical protein
MEYFRRRPFGWRDDNRAAIVAMSMGSGKIKPEDLFESLRIIKEESNSSSDKNFGQKFIERFKGNFTEQVWSDD